MLTVTTALQLDEFRGAHVVAGERGLNRPVSWVHVVGVPDAAEWLNGGELVLATANNVPDDADGQRRYMEALVDKGVSGLVLTVGRYITQSPAPMREVADAHDFPLVEIPFQARFVDIARAANQRIAQENMAMTERALHINRVLTQVVLEGGDLTRLAETMASLIGQSISIENERFEILASHNVAPVDEARRYTLTEGRTNPQLLNALEQVGALERLRKMRRPVYLPQMPDVGLELERILAPIVVHDDIYGYIWIIADDRPLNDLDRMAIESGAMVAALMILYQEASQNAEASLKGGLLSQLIQGDTRSETVLVDQALRYGVNLNAPFVLLMIDALPAGSSRGSASTSDSERDSQPGLQVYRRVNRLAAQHGWRSVVGQFAGQVVMLTAADTDLAAITAALHEPAGQPDREAAMLRVAVSAPQRGAGQVITAYTQCRDALHIAARLGDQRPTVYFASLGYLHALYRAGRDSLDANPYVPILRRLLPEQQADLFHTLEVYLDGGGNGVRTAEVLNIHRSTLNYRLGRIAEICGVELEDPLERTNLQIALKLLRLFEVEG